MSRIHHNHQRHTCIKDGTIAVAKQDTYILKLYNRVKLCIRQTCLFHHYTTKTSDANALQPRKSLSCKNPELLIFQHTAPDAKIRDDI